MKFTDKEALRQLRIARNSDLEERIDDWDESERNGRSDLQLLADEGGYLYSLYSEETMYYEDLEEAKEILRETKNGKSIPLNVHTLKPIYRSYQIDQAKNSVNEYRRLSNLVNRLAKMGYYSYWL